MKYFIIFAAIMWAAFFCTNAKSHDIEKHQLEEIQEQLNDMTLEIVTIILENLPAILESIEKDLLKEKEIPCWKRYPRELDCIPKMTPMVDEMEKND